MARREAAKVVPVCLEQGLRELSVEPRYGEVLLVVLSRGELLGRVRLPALSVVPVDVQRAAIAEELGWALWEQELRASVGRIAAPAPLGTGAPAPAVSVVVCTRDRADQLRACLESVLRLRTPPAEIVVVDNRPSDDSTKAVCAEYPVRYVREDTPGTARARNRGVAEARGEIVAFTDDDCIVDPGWLDDVAADFADPLVMVVTGPVEPLELETRAQYLFELHGAFTRVFTRRVHDMFRFDPVSAPYHAGATANALVRRSAFALVGGFDELLGAGTPTRTGEDPEFFYRVLVVGYRLVATPARLVWHRHRREEAELRSALSAYAVAVFAHTTRCLVRRREPGVLGMWAYWWLRYPRLRLRQALLREEDRVPLRLVLAELTGAAAGPWRLLRSWWARRRVQPLEPPAVHAGATPRVVQEDAPRLSIVVPSYNRRRALHDLLRGLERQTYPRDRFEVVVVLDGSTDGSGELVRSLELPYRCTLVEQPNAGATAARNNGVAHAREDVVVFLDDDIVPDPAFLAEHALAHRGARRRSVAVGYCPPVIREPGLWPVVLRSWWEDHYRRKAEPGHQWTYIDLTVGNCSLERSLFLEFGGLDEDFRSRGREDWELGLRMLRDGVRFEYVPSAIGRHHVDARIETRLRLLRQEARDDILFASKHPAVRSQLLLGELAGRLSADGSARLVRSYEHPAPSERLAAAALPALKAFEGLRLRARWVRLAQALFGHAYMRGIADVFPRPEDFLEFYASAWETPPVVIPVSLDERRRPILAPAAGPAELELAVGGKVVRRIPVTEPDEQWEWQTLATRVADAAGAELFQERVLRELGTADLGAELLSRLEEATLLAR